MKSEEEVLKRHLADLGARALSGGYYVYSEFLSPAEQVLLNECHRTGTVGAHVLWGGYEGAERKLCAFGSEEELGYPPSFPAVWLRIAPIAKKFADDLTHRDFLGSLMGLGLRREVLGDILLDGKEGYLFVLEGMAPYIIENLTKVRHTQVVCQQVEAPSIASAALPEEVSFVAAGERLDALVAAIYRLSRSESAALVEKGLVALDGKVTEKGSAVPLVGTMVSVRGYGRFLYGGVCGDTRKGRLRILAHVYK